VKTALAVFSHYGDSPNIIPAARKTYSGPLEMGDDLMTITIGEKIEAGEPPSRNHEVKKQARSQKQESPVMAADAPTSASASELFTTAEAAITDVTPKRRRTAKWSASGSSRTRRNFDEVVLADTIDPCWRSVA